MDTGYWKLIIGPLLGKDFYLRGKNDFLSLHYDGPNFRKINQCGGERPAEGATSACIGGINTHYSSIQQVQDFIKKLVQQTLRELEALS